MKLKIQIKYLKSIEIKLKIQDGTHRIHSNGTHRIHSNEIDNSGEFLGSFADC